MTDWNRPRGNWYGDRGYGDRTYRGGYRDEEIRRTRAGYDSPREYAAGGFWPGYYGGIGYPWTGYYGGYTYPGLYGGGGYAYGPEAYGEPGPEFRRGWWDRAGDEVASWFGDDEAERRRREDERYFYEANPQYRGRGPKGYVRSDERIREDVNDRLTDDPFLDATEIDVRVSEREVTLDGTVETRWAKRHAEDLAEGVSGVVHVQNNLRVRGQDRPGTVTSTRTATEPTGGTAPARRRRT